MVRVGKGGRVREEAKTPARSAKLQAFGVGLDAEVDRSDVEEVPDIG